MLRDAAHPAAAGGQSELGGTPGGRAQHLLQIKQFFSCSFPTLINRVHALPETKSRDGWAELAPVYLFVFSFPFVKKKKKYSCHFTAVFVGCGVVLLISACNSRAGGCLTYCLPAAKWKSPNLCNPFKRWQMKRRHTVANLCSWGSEARAAW